MRLLSALFRIERLRRRLAFELRQNYFEEFEVTAPIGHGLQCPIVRHDNWWSFEEVFFSNEYRPLFNLIVPPGRWLDLGCHAGFFSLLTILERRKQGLGDDFSALLVDGDSRVKGSIEAMTRLNRLENRLQFLHAAVAAKGEEVFFEESFVMSSSISKSGRRVAVAKPEQILKLLPGPYDLIKVDVEGAEHDFLTAYAPVLEQTKHLLLEWHSWHFGGGGLAAIREAATKAGFCEVAELSPARTLADDPGKSCGVLLWERRK